MRGPSRREFLRSVAAGVGLACAVGPVGCTRRKPMPVGRFQRVIVLGIDGLDPAIVDEGMKAGWLPAFARLAARGGFRSFGTTNPAQSPVAWCALATGMNPGAFGVFGFLHCDFDRYVPVPSIMKRGRGGLFMKCRD